MLFVSNSSVWDTINIECKLMFYSRTPSDELKAKIETAEEELKKERDHRLEKERENSR